MRHKESDLQIRCVRWFRVTYPAFARLLEHPRNEGNDSSARDRRRSTIAKKEGVMAGVADLILHLPAEFRSKEGDITNVTVFTALAIEMKTKTGRQSPGQKLWQRYFEAAGGKYVIVRSFEEFEHEVAPYMCGIPSQISYNVKVLHDQIEQENADAAKKELERIINE